MLGKYLSRPCQPSGFTDAKISQPHIVEGWHLGLNSNPTFHNLEVPVLLEGRAGPHRGSPGAEDDRILNLVPGSGSSMTTLQDCGLL